METARHIKMTVNINDSKNILNSAIFQQPEEEIDVLSPVFVFAFLKQVVTATDISGCISNQRSRILHFARTFQMFFRKCLLKSSNWTAIDDL
jgi:hypothetical protein